MSTTPIPGNLIDDLERTAAVAEYTPTPATLAAHFAAVARVVAAARTSPTGPNPFEDTTT